MTTSDTFTLWDGSTFFSLDGARKFAQRAYDLGVERVAIVIDVEWRSGLETISLRLDYREMTGRGSRTRRTSTHVMNPDGFDVWASLTEVAR